MSAQDNRPSWDEYFKDILTCTRKRSTCNKLKVSCVLTKDNRIISQGYNGYLPGCPHESIIIDNHEVGTIHAEQNAIIDCAKRGVSCNETTAYITHYPCFNCMKILCASGIKDIKYMYDYNNDSNVENLSSITKVKITKI